MMMLMTVDSLLNVIAKIPIEFHNISTIVIDTCLFGKQLFSSYCGSGFLGSQRIAGVYIVSTGVLVWLAG